MEKEENYEEQRQNYYDIQKEKEQKKQLMKQRDGASYLGWIALLLALTGYGAPLAIFLAIYAIKSKKHNSTVAIIALVFSSALLLILLFLSLFA